MVSSRIRYCVGQDSSKGCFQALLPSITPADKVGGGGGGWDVDRAEMQAP